MKATLQELEAARDVVKQLVSAAEPLSIADMVDEGKRLEWAFADGERSVLAKIQSHITVKEKRKSK